MQCFRGTIMLTERLFIRPLQSADWPHMQIIGRDFRTSPYACYDRPLPDEDSAIQALTRHFSESGLFFAVFPKGQDSMIGYVNFHQEGSLFHIGYCFLSSCQGQGYARESCEALLQHLKILHPGCQFQAGTAMENAPSRYLLEKLGFILTGTEEIHFTKEEAGQDITFEGAIYILPRTL